MCFSNNITLQLELYIVLYSITTEATEVSAIGCWYANISMVVAIETHP